MTAAAFGGRRRSSGAPSPLRPLIQAYTATFGSTWRPVTQRKHRDDFARFVGWLEEHEHPVSTASLSFFTLVDYVGWLRCRPKEDQAVAVACLEHHEEGDRAREKEQRSEVEQRVHDRE
jgi:hypothetical protein